jgi:predicted N-formylglutamate amidohydrolase
VSASLSRWSLIVTAEHGGHDVPPEYAGLFRGRDDLLASHRGWDAGTLKLARSLAKGLGATPITSTVTRLLVDLNRSAHNPRVFSQVTRSLSREERVSLLERFHRPHWDRVLAAASRGVANNGLALHLGVHSFTPELDGKIRTPDLALLYDPSRPLELELATLWADALSEALPDREVRRNNPYRGAADGLTSALRRRFAATRYIGLEIEVNQKHVGEDGTFPKWVGETLLSTLRAVLG